MATVLFPIPRCDFDPTEVAVSWRVLTSLGHSVRFATPTDVPARPTGSCWMAWVSIPGAGFRVSAACG